MCSLFQTDPYQEHRVLVDLDLSVGGHAGSRASGRRSRRHDRLRALDAFHERGRAQRGEPHGPDARPANAEAPRSGAAITTRTVARTALRSRVPVVDIGPVRVRVNGGRMNGGRMNMFVHMRRSGSAPLLLIDVCVMEIVVHVRMRVRQRLMGV